LSASKPDLDSGESQSSQWSTAGLNLTIFLRGWLLILVVCAVGGSAVYFASVSRTPAYEANTTLFVRTGQSSVSVSLGEIQASRELGRTFKELIKTTSVLEQVRDELGLPYSISGLRGSISVNVVAGTQLITISARDSSPVLAADISDTVARVFIVQREEAGLTEIARLQATLEQYGIFDSAELLASQINSLGGLQIAQSAELPTKPVSPRPLRDTIMGIIAGFGLALVLVVVLDRIDVRVKTDSGLSEIAKSFNIGSVGIILREMIQKTFRPEPGKDGSVTTEAFMFLAAKILDHQHEHIAVRDYLVTSVHQNEGKTVVSANLAAALASANRKVILVDFDLRKPDI
jgi:receptor protein-tyrosine kinase